MSARQILALVKALAVEDQAFEHRTAWKGRPVRLQNRGPSSWMGRFGGGWERQLGVQLGPDGLEGTVIVNLWKGSIRIDPAPRR